MQNNDNPWNLADPFTEHGTFEFAPGCSAPSMEKHDDNSQEMGIDVS